MVFITVHVVFWIFSIGPRVITLFMTRLWFMLRKCCRRNTDSHWYLSEYPTRWCIFMPVVTFMPRASFEAMISDFDENSARLWFHCYQILLKYCNLNKRYLNISQIFVRCRRKQKGINRQPHGETWLVSAMQVPFIATFKSDSGHMLRTWFMAHRNIASPQHGVCFPA